MSVRSAYRAVSLDRPRDALRIAIAAEAEISSESVAAVTICARR